MKNKLKFIIPIVIAVIAIIVAALCIDFTPTERVDIPSLVSTAQKYLIENNYEQAIAEFNKIIEIDPMNVDAYIGIADAYIGIGDTEKAIEWLEKGYELTGNERLKNMIDELNSENYVEETVDTTVTESEIGPLSEAASVENRITYADGWYSIFKYDNKNISSMTLYDKSGDERLNANYEYIGNDVKRTVYVDDILYETDTVIFRDFMADFTATTEKLKKERSNTKEEYSDDDDFMGSYNMWYFYDENGDCIEKGYHSLSYDDDYGDDCGYERYFKNDKIYKSHVYCYHNDPDFSILDYDYIIYYDENEYPLSEKGKSYGSNYNITYTYQYDDNGYPIIQYKNNEKGNEYINYYKDNKFVYAIRDEKNGEHGIGANDDSERFVDYANNSCWESNENGQYIRSLYHSGSYSFTDYFIPSYDGEKIIDCIYINSIDINSLETKPLFECPYCYGEED